MEEMEKEEDLFPQLIRFNDGSAIIVCGVSDEKYKVFHGKEQYKIKSIYVSDYVKEGGIIKTEPSYSIVVEHPIDDNKNAELTSIDLQDYVVEFVREFLHGNFDRRKICHYIGRKNKELDNMIISDKVKKEIVEKELEPALKKRKMDRYNTVKAEFNSVLESRMYD